MGLDNGIVLTYKNKIKRVPKYVELTTDFLDDGEYEVCYWRKCWSLRDSIISILIKNDHMLLKTDDDELPFEFDLTIKDLTDIRNEIYETIIRGTTDPSSWDSVFEFEDMVWHLSKDIVNLTWLINFMEDNRMASAYFYDSY